mmetsp:Transcript_36063/g.103750  ORF Transcript_36063/g.103750 Transcript_36063/m.103750 type:complete len:296 (+) Transcript_36063:91-978(+)
MVPLWLFGAVALTGATAILGGTVFGYDCGTGPVHWAEAFGTSRYFGPKALLTYRFALSGLFLTMYVIYVYDTINPHWIWFMTHWSAIVRALYFCALPFATVSAVKAMKVLPTVSADDQPFSVSFAMVMLHMQLPFSFVIALLYWTLETPAHNLCVFNDSDFCEDLPGFLSCFVHGLDMLLVTGSFMIERIPFRRKCAGWFCLFTTVYTVWSCIHYLVGWADTRPLYAALNWKRPYLVLVSYIGLGFVLFPSVIFLYWALGRLRDLRDVDVEAREKPFKDPKTVELSPSPDAASRA